MFGRGQRHTHTHTRMVRKVRIRYCCSNYNDYTRVRRVRNVVRTGLDEPGMTSRWRSSGAVFQSTVELRCWKLFVIKKWLEYLIGLVVTFCRYVYPFAHC